MRRLPYGGSIPHVDEGGMKSIVIPLADQETMEALSRTVLFALEQREKALELEIRARQLVEEKIGG